MPTKLRYALHRARSSPRFAHLVHDGGILSHIAHVALVIVSLHSVEGAVTVASITFVLLGHACTIEAGPIGEALRDATETL